MSKDKDDINDSRRDINEKIINPHDKFFKSVMKDMDIARGFISNFLPVEITNELDLDTLQRADTGFVNKILSESFSDVLFTCKLKSDKSVYIPILFEHKSYFTKGTAVQVFGYISEIYIKQYENYKTLIPVVPVVVYHGKEKWKYITLEDLFEYLPTNFKKYTPTYEYEYIDLKDYNEEDLLNMENVMLSSVLLTQKYIFDEERLLKNLSTILKAFNKHRKRNLFEFSIVYILQVLEKQEIKNVVNKLPQEIKSDIMTIAQSLIQEGIQKGEYMNKVKTIVNGYKAGATIKFLALQTELPEEEVKKILDENLN